MLYMVILHLQLTFPQSSSLNGSELESIEETSSWGLEVGGEAGATAFGKLCDSMRWKPDARGPLGSCLSWIPPILLSSLPSPSPADPPWPQFHQMSQKQHRPLAPICGVSGAAGPARLLPVLQESWLVTFLWAFGSAFQARSSHLLLHVCILFSLQALTPSMNKPLPAIPYW